MFSVIEVVRDFLMLPVVNASTLAFSAGVLAFVNLAATHHAQAPTDETDARLFRSLKYSAVVAVLYEYIMLPVVGVPDGWSGTVGQDVATVAASLACATVAFIVGLAFASIVTLIRHVVCSAWTSIMVSIYGWLDRRRPEYVKKAQRTR